MRNDLKIVRFTYLLGEFISLDKKQYFLSRKLLLCLLLLLTAIISSTLSNNVYAQNGCKYLDQYLAPFNPPIEMT